LPDFRKTLKYQISWKIRPAGAELFHADRRTVRHYEADYILITNLMH